jgi:hypothetical protein
VADDPRAAVDYANEVILDNVPRSGTTLVAALIIGDVAYVVNVGDSRAYLIARDEIHQITRDHSQAWEDLQKELAKFYNSGGKPDFRWLAEFKRKFIQNHPRAHVINNVVGFFGKVEPIDVFKITLRKGDVLLLCSDGLSDVLNDHDIHKYSKQKQRRRRCPEARGGGEEKRYRQHNGGADRKKYMSLCFVIEHFCDGSIPHHMTVEIGFKCNLRAISTVLPSLLFHCLYASTPQ